MRTRKNTSAAQSTALVVIETPAVQLPDDLQAALNDDTNVADLTPEQIEAMLGAPEPVTAEPEIEVITKDDIATLDDETIAALEALENEGGPSTAPEAPSEAVQAPQAVEPSAPDQAPEDDTSAETLSEKVAALFDTDEDKKVAGQLVAQGFDDRIAFEAAKGGHFDSISKSINKSRSKLANPGAAAILIACQVPTNFMNRSLHSNSGYNVYAIDKVADIVGALQHGTIKNAVNRAIILSLFKLKAAGKPFTGEAAKACVSSGFRFDDATVRSMLIRHIASPSTAPTQASSTMAALTTLGVVRNIGSQKAAVYELLDTPQTRRLEEVAKAA